MEFKLINSTHYGCGTQVTCLNGRAILFDLSALRCTVLGAMPCRVDAHSAMQQQRCNRRAELQCTIDGATVSGVILLQ